jgi:cell division septation protein DedD
MENRNILLVIASACLFLVIVVGVGLWIFWPKPSGLESAVTASAQPLFDKGFDSYEFYKGREEIPGLMVKPDTEELTLTIGETETESEISIEQKTPETQIEKTEPIPPVQKKPAEKPVSTVKTRPPVPRKILVREYEIQVGSYENQYRAEAVNRTLKEYGVSGMIRTRSVGDNTYYRVRIGPYANQKEAEKFLGWIKNIEGLEESYISQVSRTREVQ